MRRALRAVRHLPDRLRHPGRRDATLRLIQGARPERIVFGCLGNICRSPYAAARLRAAAAAVLVDSAGFIGPGRAPPEEAQRVALARGIDVSGHRSRRFTEGDLRAESLLILMEIGHQERLAQEFGAVAAPIILLGDLDPEPIDTRAIIDPYGHPTRVFESVFTRIDRCVASLAEALGRVPGS